MQSKNVSFLARTAVVAALYAALTFALAPVSFGPIQFRVSEILVLLILVERRYLFGLTLGAVIANYFSPLGLIDMVVGGGATFLSLLLMIYFGRNLWVAAFWPCIVNGLVIGALLAYLYQLPFLLTSLQVFLGQAGVLYLLGVPFYRYLEKRQGALLEKIRIP